MVEVDLVVCAVLRRELFVVLPWEVSAGLQTGLFAVLPTAAFAEVPTATFAVLPTAAFAEVQLPRPTIGTATITIVMATVTRASWSASGSLVGAGAGVGVILTGIRPIIMLRTAIMPTLHHNIIVEPSNRCRTVAWSHKITVSRVSIYGGNRMRRYPHSESTSP